MRQRFLWGLGICYDETFLENDTGVGLDLNFGPDGGPEWLWELPLILVVDAGRNLMGEFYHPDERSAPWPVTFTK